MRVVGIHRAVSAHHDMTFGVWATVSQPGRVAVGDTVTVTRVPATD